MKCITLRADKHLIEEARKRAASERTTLNARFREWLEEYVQPRRQVGDAMATIRELRSKYSTEGRRFNKEEMNERR